MEKLILKETKHSPLVKFDPENNVFEIRGYSFLDNAHEFYTPIIDWVKTYSHSSSKNINLLFDLSYINTTSQRMVFDLLKRLNLMHKSGHSVSIDWLYDENDGDLKDVGEDLLSFMDFPYKIIEKVN